MCVRPAVRFVFPSREHIRAPASLNYILIRRLIISRQYQVSGQWRILVIIENIELTFLLTYSWKFVEFLGIFPEDPLLTSDPPRFSTKMKATYFLTLAVLAVAIQSTVAANDDDCEGIIHSLIAHTCFLRKLTVIFYAPSSVHQDAGQVLSYPHRRYEEGPQVD